MQIYVETEEGKDSFLIDEFIGAPEGTEIAGPGAPKIEVRLGDINNDGIINSVDVSLAKQIVIEEKTDKALLKAADVDQNGIVNAQDIQWLNDFVCEKVTDFPAKA